MNNPQMKVLLVDLDLPGMSGADLIDRIEARGGGVLSIIISAADIERLRAISIQRDVAFLRKPLNFGRFFRSSIPSLTCNKNPICLYQMGLADGVNHPRRPMLGTSAGFSLVPRTTALNHYVARVMSSRRTHRNDLYLRAERAFGEKWVRAGQFDSTPNLSADAQRSEVGMKPQVAQRSVSPGELTSGKSSQVAKKTGVIPLERPSGVASAIVAALVLDREEKIRRLSLLDATEVKGCTLCRLCETRTHTVFGEGDPDASIFFIGEGPGETEDRTGRPFVGPAGQKLAEMIAAMGLTLDQVFIANIVKCHPPGNRRRRPMRLPRARPTWSARSNWCVRR